jgi:glycosyltransferase involved in cell wall biosynthesis
VRLCFVANPESIHTQRWLRYFASQGHELHLIGEHATHYVPPAGVVLHDLTRLVNVRKLRYVAWGLAVRRLVREIRPDLLHAHQVTSAGWLGAAAGCHPFVVTAWGSDLLLGVRRSRAHRLLAQWVLRRADYVTCVSEELAHQARLLGADSACVEVVPWGVDTEVFRPAPPDDVLRTRLGLGKGPIVLALRGIRPVYNPLDIARAIPHVLEQVPAAQFVIRTYSYDPALLEEFRGIVVGAGATHAVHYVGDLPDDSAIADLYRLADVALSVPSSDGTPQSVLEALGCGVVPVLSDLPALRTWVRHEGEGLFVPVGDVQGLAAAIVRLLRDPALRGQMREQGVALVARRADRRVWMEHSEGIYRRLAGFSYTPIM